MTNQQPTTPVLSNGTGKVADQGGDKLAKEIARRRTFAIISHPDAGKTTLTEKLLLYSGAIEQAGAVRARKQQRAAVSDWMSIEQERGISITSTVLQFSYGDYLLNLLDTPGHQDFSEDTYRTLVAVDSAVMVLDSARGIQEQTRKLFTVCRQQALPILTFINKLDMPGRDPLELIDEIEQTLDLQVTPMNWPIGDGHDFQGVYDLQTRQVLYFERTTRGRHRAPMTVRNLDDPALAAALTPRAYERLRDDVELLTGVGTPFDRDAFLAGKLTPIYFGSAVNNFGVEPFLAGLVELAPPPRARPSDQGPVEPSSTEFSGFVFKIQANMDPKHRDRMAFIRVCSGQFEKDMTVYHPRLERTVRMSRPHRLFAAERETVADAYPGDVIGLSNPGTFTIGDTVCTGTPLRFAPITAFQPEHFARLHNEKIEKSKQFNKGIEQLVEEAVIQVFYPIGAVRRAPILAAVGILQFDVVVARLAAEYGVETRIESLPHSAMRWISGSAEEIEAVRWPTQSMRAHDQAGRLVVIFSTVWELKVSMENNPRVGFHEASDLHMLPTTSKSGQK